MNGSTTLGKLGDALRWNVASVGVQALGGLALNVAIGRWFGEGGLGVFSQLVGLHILFSQLGVFGVHYAAARYAAVRGARPNRHVELYWSSLGVCLMTTTVVVIAAMVLSPLLLAMLPSATLAGAWWIALPGLWCFCLNKVLLQFLNGAGRYRPFTVLSALRFALWLAAVFLLASRYPNQPAWVLGGGVTLCEGVLLLLLLLLSTERKLPSVSAWLVWNRRVLRFGRRSFLSGALIEFNTRIDVFFLGALVGDKAVGVFALAGFFVEGVFQIVVALRNSVQPKLNEWLEKGVFWQELRAVQRIALWAVALVSLGTAAILPWLCQTLLGRHAFEGSVATFIIMATGLTLAAPQLVLSMALVQCGKPSWQTLSLLGQAMAAVVLNALLIPLAGVQGAALATGLSFGVSAGITRTLLRKLVVEREARRVTTFQTVRA
jgi:O-antigen/teichoic acid export membrane protein